MRILSSINSHLWLALLLLLTNAQQQQQPPTPTTAYFEHKTVLIPHDDKKHRGGEDAASTSPSYLIVADGVGGWANKGVNPGLYSKLLTKTIVANGTKHPSTPLVELVDAANHFASEQHLGTATCTALQISEGDGVNGGVGIKTLNIGDSGYSIHRRSSDKNNNNNHKLEVVFASEASQKGFNFPYQIGGRHGDDVKSSAVEMEHSDIQPKEDIIVVYSDGVSDNLYPREFHPCIEEYADTDNTDVDDGYELVSLSLVADCIARTAYELGKRKDYLSPFAKEARKTKGRYHYIGGKHDDITVVVARVRLLGGSGKNNPVVAPIVAKDDPYYEESIFIYTEDVPPRADLPKLDDLVMRVGGEL